MRRTLSATVIGLCSKSSHLSWTFWLWHSSISLESSRPSSEEYVWIYYWFTSKYHILIFSSIYSTGKWLQKSLGPQIPRKSSQTLDKCFCRSHNSNHWTDIQPDLLSRLLQMVGKYSSRLVTNAAHLWLSLTGFSFTSKFKFRPARSSTIHNPPLTTCYNMSISRKYPRSPSDMSISRNLSQQQSQLSKSFLGRNDSFADNRSGTRTSHLRSCSPADSRPSQRVRVTEKGKS